jgi:hypothetical protein
VGLTRLAGGEVGLNPDDEVQARLRLVFTTFAELSSASLARPGGDVTGVSQDAGQESAKRMDLLKETCPGMTRVAGLWNQTNVREAWAPPSTTNMCTSLAARHESHQRPGAIPLFIARCHRPRSVSALARSFRLR